MAGCGCSALKASGDPRGMSISGFGKVGTRKRGKAHKKSGKKSSAAKRLLNSGSFCVTWKKSGKKSCNFKTKAAATKFARGRGTVSAKK